MLILKGLYGVVPTCGSSGASVSLPCPPAQGNGLRPWFHLSPIFAYPSLHGRFPLIAGPPAVDLVSGATGLPLNAPAP